MVVPTQVQVDIAAQVGVDEVFDLASVCIGNRADSIVGARVSVGAVGQVGMVPVGNLPGGGGRSEGSLQPGLLVVYKVTEVGGKERDVESVEEDLAGVQDEHIDGSVVVLVPA